MLKLLFIFGLLPVYLFSSEFTQIKNECNNGNIESCYTLGSMYSTGKGIGKNKIKAKELFNEACKDGSQKACLEYKKLEKFIHNVFVDIVKEKVKKCKYGDMKACHALGDMYSENDKNIRIRKTTKGLYNKACNGGYGDSCLSLALLYLKENNKVKALTFFEKSCKLDNAEGCQNAGVIYQDGDTTKVDFNKAKQYATKACSLESAEGCYDLAIIYDRGHITKKNKIKRNKLYKKACDGGITEACNILAIAGKIPHNTKMKEVEEVEEECNNGNMEICTQLAQMYYAGNEVIAQDKQKAFSLFSKACKKKKGAGCFHLGVIYYMGDEIIKQDKKQAFKYYKKACELNNSRGCYNVGTMYEEGVVVEKSLPLASIAYNSACNNNNIAACFNFGNLLFQNGATAEKIKAAELYEKACKGNFVAACMNFGNMNRNGLGVKKDLKKAITAYKKACNSGDSDACSIVRVLDKKIN